jgi:hypothetical protein
MIMELFSKKYIKHVAEYSKARQEKNMIVNKQQGHLQIVCQSLHQNRLTINLNLSRSKSNVFLISGQDFYGYAK